MPRISRDEVAPCMGLVRFNPARAEEDVHTFRAESFRRSGGTRPGWRAPS